MQTLDDRVVVITGAGNGIGRALALAFAAAGSRLVLADLEEPALADVRSELESTGTDVLTRVTDVASYESVERLAEAAVEAFGGVHVVCNNAGISTSGRSIADLAVEDWRWTFDVNVFGVVHGIHAFLPILLEQEEGHVLNTASAAALVGSAYVAAYASSKAAVLHLSETLQRELTERGANVGVSVLLPGAVNTTIGRSEERRPAAHARTTQTEPMHTPEHFTEWLERGRQAGMDPADVALMALDAVRARRFYVFTHPGTPEQAAARAADMADGRNPGPAPSR
ncbi:MAG: SDR family NAD(P)-dependent oxidoreductase [Acidimicrobiia bacterium]